MASYQGHLTFSTVLGAGFGAAGIWFWNLDWGPAFLGAGMTALGGMLPDLDSDSGVPVRELFGLSAAVTPCLLFSRLRHADFTLEQTLVVLMTIYLLIRYGLARAFKKITVHRGMFHSIPAMFIAGLAVYMLYEPGADPRVRIFLAVGTMLGFLSHLVLDELYSVDFRGLSVQLNKYAGSALKLHSSSWQATLACYLLLGTLVALTLGENELARLQDLVVVRIK